MLYFVFFVLPVVVLFMLARDWWRGTVRPGMPNAGAKMFAAAVMIGVVNVALGTRAHRPHSSGLDLFGSW